MSLLDPQAAAALGQSNAGDRMGQDLAAKADEVVIFAAASEAFSQRNINCSIEESLERFAPVAQAAKEAGMRLRGSISCSFGCPYEGAVAPSNVLKVGKRLIELGCDEIDVADTIGVGTARQVYEVMRMVTEHIDPIHVSGHFHDTYGQAIANIVASMQAGIHIFHSSVAGLGGCPYAKGATGNVATEDLVWMLNGLGVETGVDLEKLVATSTWMAQQLGRPSPSAVVRALGGA